MTDEFHHTLEDMPIRDNDKWFSKEDQMKLNLNYVVGFNSDYIIATVSTDESVVEKEFFSPGKGCCSFKAEDATSDTPFVGDLISALIAEYNISRDDITFSGKWAFTGIKMTIAEAAGIIASCLNPIFC